MEGLGDCFTRLRLWSRCRSLATQASDESMNVAEDPKIADMGALEGEYWSSVPPNVSSGRRDAEEFATVVSMEAELAENLTAFLPEFEDVRGVPVERGGDKVDIADELLMADQLRT